MNEQHQQQQWQQECTQLIWMHRPHWVDFVKKIRQRYLLGTKIWLINYDASEDANMLAWMLAFFIIGVAWIYKIYFKVLKFNNRNKSEMHICVDPQSHPFRMGVFLKGKFKFEATKKLLHLINSMSLRVRNGHWNERPNFLVPQGPKSIQLRASE